MVTGAKMVFTRRQAKKQTLQCGLLFNLYTLVVLGNPERKGCSASCPRVTIETKHDELPSSLALDLLRLTDARYLAQLTQHFAFNKDGDWSLCASQTEEQKLG
jgi:hypothetical protein